MILITFAQGSPSRQAGARAGANLKKNMSNYKVFKFGGGSVNNAEAFQQALRIIRTRHPKPLIVVLSALGKTTNALEEIARLAWAGEDYSSEWQKVEAQHLNICDTLFPAGSPSHLFVKSLGEMLRERVKARADAAFDMFYDQIVPLGERLSVNILQTLLHQHSLGSIVAKAEDLILCDPPFRAARVRWQESTEKLCSLIREDDGNIWIIPGFTGGTFDGKSITLGREGSDFTAAIIAYALDAAEVTIWKDVPGIMNADPRDWPAAVKYDTMPYREAMELAFYGAKVIHPKTIKPLENKRIPLIVKSFSQPEAPGTRISADLPLSPMNPSIILKKNQILFTLTPRDYAFINEGHIHRILGELYRRHLRSHLMQASAIQFSFCTDEAEGLEANIQKALSEDFIIRYNQGLQLLTLRHYQEERWQSHFPDWDVLLEQRSRTTIQALLRKRE